MIRGTLLTLVMVCGLMLSGCTGKNKGMTCTKSCNMAMKCAGCGMDMKCGDAVVKCEACGYSTTCAELMAKCPMAGKGCCKDGPCAKMMECPKCKAKMACTNKCPHCAKA